MVMLMGRTDTTPANRAVYAAPSAVDTTVIFAASTAYHYAAIFNGASSSSDINGTTSTGSPGSFGVVNGITIGPNFSGSGNTANGIDLYLCEIFCITDTVNL